MNDTSDKALRSSNEHTQRVVAAARKAISGQRIAVGSPLHLLEMFIKIVEERPTVETGAPHLSDLWVTRLMDRHGFLAPVAGRMGDLVRDAFRSGQEAIGLPEDDRGPYCPQISLPCDRMCQTICNRRALKAAEGQS